MNKSSHFFIKRPFVMDPKEKHFYEALITSVGDSYYIWPKVLLAHLLELPYAAENGQVYEDFCTVANKHVDFVICDKNTFNPLLVVRFKGMISHTDEVLYKEKDILKEILKMAGLPLLIESATELTSYKSSAEHEALQKRIHEAIEEANVSVKS